MPGFTEAGDCAPNVAWPLASSARLRASQVLYLETTAAGGITWEEVESARLSGGGGAGERAVRRKLSIKIPAWCGRWAVGMDEYADGVVGAKSKNLAGAQPCLSFTPGCCLASAPVKRVSVVHCKWPPAIPLVNPRPSSEHHASSMTLHHEHDVACHDDVRCIIITALARFDRLA